MPRSSRAKPPGAAPSGASLRLTLSQSALTAALLGNQEAVTGRVSEIVEGFRAEVLHELDQQATRLEAIERELSDIREVLGLPPRELGA